MHFRKKWLYLDNTYVLQKLNITYFYHTFFCCKFIFLTHCLILILFDIYFIHYEYCFIPSSHLPVLSSSFFFSFYDNFRSPFLSISVSFLAKFSPHSTSNITFILSLYPLSFSFSFCHLPPLAFSVLHSSMLIFYYQDQYQRNGQIKKDSKIQSDRLMKSFK